ncbi:hypothetical protein WJX74_001771 [Apatococcus lobatus]|uniref:Uncharacterized protein n=1 Tax=Apatococcus lobatus TaxID=904363 RepID=A0AAW1QH76_9CHLO
MLVYPDDLCILWQEQAVSVEPSAGNSAEAQTNQPQEAPQAPYFRHDDILLKFPHTVGWRAVEPRAPRLTPKSVHDLGRLPTHCHLVTRDFDMWYHEYDEETCAPTGTYHQGIARQFCHSEPPLTVVLGGVSPARVPHTDQWIPAAEGVVTSADETWMRCYGLADLVKYLTPRLYRLTPEEIEQAKAQSIQEMETRARKRQETAAARQQQQSTAQPDTVDQQQTVYREDVDFFGDLSHSTPSTPARRRAANYHRQS